MDFAERMKKAKEDAQSGGSFKALPNDTYMAVLESAFYNESKQKKTPQINFDYKIIEGEYEGEVHRVFRNLVHDVSLSILSQDLEKMGYDNSICTSETELDEMVKECASKKPIVQITIYDGKNGFKNTKVVDFLGYEGAGEADVSAAPDVSSDDDGVGVGKKYKYKHKGQTLTGTVKSINYENETLDFGLVKDVPLDDVLEPVA